MLVASAAGLTDRKTTTVYVPTTANELGPSRNEPIVRATPLGGKGFSPSRIYTARSPGVVTVFAFFDNAGEQEAQGSGFVVSPAGYILTSAHVVTDAVESSNPSKARDVFIVFKNGDRVRAKIVGWDGYDDVALLQVDPAARRLVTVPLGDSSRVRPGDPVAAMGTPFGNEDSIAVGVVSAIHRSISSLTTSYNVVDAIQTDAPITHGNSGGPLFDARGRVIGINAQIRSESGGAEGVGFAIPINAAKRSMAQLIATGQVVYAFLGVTTEDLTPTLARHLGYSVSRGAMVGQVRAGSPADHAGSAWRKRRADVQRARRDQRWRRDRRRRRTAGAQRGPGRARRQLQAPGRDDQRDRRPRADAKDADRKARRSARRGDQPLIDDVKEAGYRVPTGQKLMSTQSHPAAELDNPTVRLTIPAKAEYITLVRLALSGLSGLRPLSDETLGDLKLAVTEACTNSVRHGYNDGDGTVEVVYELQLRPARRRGRRRRSRVRRRR